MRVSLPLRWQTLLMLSVVITALSASVLLPSLLVAELSERSQTTTLNVRERVRQIEGQKRGRLIPLGGRGRPEPTRIYDRHNTGLQRAIRDGTFPTMTKAQERRIRRRSRVPMAVRKATE